MQPDSSSTPESENSLSIAVLVSVGCHPLTGRPRRADQDARALEMAFSVEGATPALLHAGPCDDVGEDALRTYLGMGGGTDLDSLIVLEQTADADVLPSLTDELKALGPQLVLCGMRAETGEGSGMLPYLLAERLGWPIISGVAAVESIQDGVVVALQALPRGQRRRLSVRLPAIATVDSAAPAPRASAYGPARRGTLPVFSTESTADEAQNEWLVSPARKRPKRLKIITATSARERFRAAAAKAQGGSGKVLKDVSPEAAAEAIQALLKEEGVLR
ncbi:electron transfer flavoprotein subunit beta [Marinobacter sp.]|uniref:electron transfer flavoprotein subunit beta n=1 Tax=Marinobacter sp. TaxID=50741 RepID=UPI00384B1826